MHIESLEPGEIFVFGSNASGAHGAGAALTAYERFGAVWGQGSGLQGRAYGIDTMSGMGVLRREADEFAAFARAHPELTFLLTPVGCGIAGYSADEMAPLFEAAPGNVVLPETFRAVLEARDAARSGHAHEDVAPADRQAYWDARYGDSERLWSGTVNAALADVAAELRPGTALDLGCGEGGDALWLAARGWRVAGVDVSAVALERADAEARARGIDSVTWRRVDLETWHPGQEFDLVSACFLQAPHDFDRAGVLHRMSAHVRSGGHMLVVSHAAMPPWSQHHDHADLPTVRGERAAVGDEAAWHVVIAEVRQRRATSPDGDEVTVDDNVVLLRRR